MYTGALDTAETAVGRPAKIQVVETPENEVVIDRPQVVQMVQTSENFWQRFNGEISWGFIYSKGNQSTQFNLGSETAYVRERWNAKANFSSTLASSTGTNASTRNALGLSALRLLPWNNWFYSGLGTFLQSSEQGINLQTTVGGGIGRYLKNTNRASISVLGGVAWLQTNYKPALVPLGATNVGSALIAADVRLFKFSKTNLSATATSSQPFLSRAASESMPTLPITSSSSATCRGIFRFMATGITSLRQAFPGATTVPARG